MTKPSKNAVTGEYTNAHKAYDYSGRGDSGIYACLAGNVIQSVNLYNTSWQSTPPLATKDYGNFIKLKHDDGTFSLYAHLKKDSLLPVGTRVVEGQRIATVGNTGNSTGTHLHFEYRNSSNTNIKPVFTEASMNELESCLNDRKKFWEERDSLLRELNAENMEGGISSIRGLRSRITDLGNQVGILQAEVSNREEQVSRIEKQVLDAQATNKLLSSQLKAAMIDVDKFAKDKGTLEIALSKLQVQYDTLKQAQTEGSVTLTIGQLVRLILKQKITIKK
jgi:septal ring factor EnvC (AmiA/AmiB activator)